MVWSGHLCSLHLLPFVGLPFYSARRKLSHSRLISSLPQSLQVHFLIRKPLLNREERT